MSEASETRKSVTVFLDTMIFLHFKLFDEVDWRTVLQADNITITILPVIVGELDKHKDTHPNQKIRKRAKSVTRKFHDLFENSLDVKLKEGLIIKYEDIEPKINFKSNNLNPDRQDDYQLASIIQYKNDHPDESVILITQDFNFRTKAKVRGIDTIKMPDELELPDEPDPNEKVIKELQQELLEFKKQFPSLKVRFKEGSDRVTFTLIKFTELSKEEIGQRVEQIKQKYPKMKIRPEKPSEPSDENKPKQGGVLIDLLNMIGELDVYSDSDKKEYNDALDTFYSRYEAFLNYHLEYTKKELLTVELDILLLNEGNAPAEDVDIYLHFPDGFELREEASDRPREPKPPKRPLTPAQKVVQRPAWQMPTVPYISSPRASGINNPTSPNVSGPNIRRTKSYDVHFKVRRIKHNSSISFRRLYLTFDSFEEAKSFGIEYRINAGNVPREVTGFLNVIIKKDYESNPK